MSQKATASKTTESQSNSVPVNTGITKVSSDHSTHGEILQLHRRYGNRAVQRMHASGILQPKLKIGQPNDKYEQEADLVADKVLTNRPVSLISKLNYGNFSGNSNLSGGSIQHAKLEDKEENKIQSASKEEEEPAQTKLLQREAKEEEEPTQTKLLQLRKDSEGNESFQTKRGAESLDSTSRLIDHKSGGNPMQPDVRGLLEAKMGADFSNVRVHEDGDAHNAAASINAKAFTHKNDIWLGEGQSQTDLHLMAHEATHAIQQGGARQKTSDTPAIQKKEYDGPMAVSLVDQLKAIMKAKTSKRQALAELKKGRKHISSEEEEKEKEKKAEESAEKEKKKAEQETEGLDAKEKKGEKKGKGGKGKGRRKKKKSLKKSAAFADLKFRGVVGRARNRVTSQKKHSPAAKEADAAQQAAESPASELESKAQSNQVDTMEKVETPAFDAAGFKAKLMKRIEAMAPGSAKEADNFKGSGKVSGLKTEMSKEVDTQKTSTQKPMKEAAEAKPDASGIDPKPVTPLKAPKIGPKPANINARGAAPKNKKEKDVEKPIKENTQRIGDRMGEYDITEEQLAKANEPEFTRALEGKKKAETQAVHGPRKFRGYEKNTLDAAQQEAVVMAKSSLASMHSDRKVMTKGLGESQQQAKGKDEQAREKVASDIKAIYDDTKEQVDIILTDLDADVSDAFDDGAEEARDIFENYVADKMDAYKEERYGGWLGWARWAKDKIASMPDEVNEFYVDGKNLYLDEMDAVIDRVVKIIGRALTDAKAKVAKGKKRIAEYVAALPDDLKKVGKEAADDIQDKFDELEQSINDKEDQLITSLATKYDKNVKAVDKRIKKLKEANKGLVEKAVDAVGSVIEAIKKIKNMLKKLFAKIASVIGLILKDPIGFLSNMIDALKQGFKRFVSKIKTHLIGALVKWLTGALGPVNINITGDIFSAKGAFSLVTQALGLTKEYFRAKAVKVLGEPAVKVLETSSKLFMMVQKKGVEGSWEYVEDKFSDIKKTVIDGIQNMLIVEVIKAGVKWVIGLLNPASAFVKAAMAIYEIGKFFVERGRQIFEFVNSVVDSFAKVAKGNISGAAKMVETALANLLPLIIGFLASLLGISGLAQKVQKIIGRVRKKIDRVINKLLMKIKKSAGKLLGKGKAAVGKLIAWWKVRKRFGKGKDSHTLYFKGTGKSAKLMVNSTPTKFATFVNKFDAKEGSPEVAVQAKAKAKAKKLDELIARISSSKDKKFKKSEGKGIKPAIEEIGSLLSKLGEAKKGLHTGSASDPIPISWYKRPGDYPRNISLKYTVKETQKKVKERIPMFGEKLLKRLNREYTIGVSSSNMVNSGKILRRGSENEREGKQASFRRVLERHGYNWTGMDADHVTDIGFGGPDHFNNLWPLKEGINRIAFKKKWYQKYRVAYLDKSENVKIDRLSAMNKFFFKIKGFSHSAPAEPGGKD